MTCPLCKIEMRIANSKNVVEHDDTPNEATRLYVVQELKCRNEQCQNFNKLVDTVKIELPIG